MTTPYTSSGYQDLREYALSTYTHVAVINANGNEETRIDVTTDSRMKNSPDASSNPITYQFKLMGEDNDIDNPVTITKTQLFTSDSATTVIGEDTMEDATIEADGDELVVSHEQQIPP